MNTSTQRIYLASKSPRRRELLERIGIRFDVLHFPSLSRNEDFVDETVLPNEAPDTYVVRVARTKAEHAAQLVQARRVEPRLILSADTTLDVDGDILGKPDNAEHAQAMLARLSGREHEVLTAVALAHNKGIEHVLSRSFVRFRAMSEAEIAAYVATGEPMDKAGAYGLQGRAAMFIEAVRGSPTGIIGLPLCETLLLLRKFGYPA
jgi:septum formation protein